MGKPISQAMNDVKKVISFCDYYSKNFDPIMPTMLETDATKKSMIKY